MTLLKSLTEFYKYIDIPFKDLGRDLKGVDCFGLVKYIYKDKLNIDIGETEITAGDFDGIESEIKRFSNMFQRVFEPRIYDIIFCYKSPSERIVNHIALYIGAGRIIHAVNGQGVVIEKAIRNPAYMNMIEGFYRYKGEMNK
jgi:cell wall-associated NlpC family hydrolase